MTAETRTSVSLKETTVVGKSFLQFNFQGHLDLESATEAIEAWRKQLTPNQKINLIYNCLEMTGFDTPARKIWQLAMSDLKASTGSIWIISSNAFILGAAKTMGLLSGYDIKVAKNIEGIKP
jgi:hypothetical protein